MQVLRLSFSGMTPEKKTDAGPTTHLSQCGYGAVHRPLVGGFLLPQGVPTQVQASPSWPRGEGPVPQPRSLHPVQNTLVQSIEQQGRRCGTGWPLVNMYHM